MVHLKVGSVLGGVRYSITLNVSGKKQPQWKYHPFYLETGS